MNSSLPVIRIPVRPVITDPRLYWLWPPPRQMQQLAAQPFLLSQPWNISFIASSFPLHRYIIDSLTIIISTLNCFFKNQSTLDIWDAHKPTLVLLGIDPVIGNIGVNTPGSSAGNSVICCVKADIFPNQDSYRLTIASDKVIYLFYLFFKISKSNIISFAWICLIRYRLLAPTEKDCIMLCAPWNN